MVWAKAEALDSTTFKPQRGDINIARGNAPGNPSYAHVEYMSQSWSFGLQKFPKSRMVYSKREQIGLFEKQK